MALIASQDRMSRFRSEVDALAREVRIPRPMWERVMLIAMGAAVVAFWGWVIGRIAKAIVERF